MWSPLKHNQLAVIQRWSVYTVEPVYVVTLETQPQLAIYKTAVYSTICSVVI